MYDKAKLIARFPQYKGVDGRTLEIYASGEGSTRRIAVKQAIKKLFKDPAIFHKSPDYINIEIVTDDTMPFLHGPRG